ncbi:MAG: CvpA family protein [Cellulosilyticaceae bacterium]
MLDGIVILVIAVMTIVAAKKGFIRSAYGLLASILALVVAYFIYPIMNAFLKVTPLYHNILQWNTERLASIELVSGLQTQADMIKKATGWLPKFIGEEIIHNNNPEVYRVMGATNIAEYISGYITGLCISALALIITWLLVRMILGIMMRTLDLIAKLPVISTANKYAGAALGTVKGVLLMWVLGLLMPLMITLPQFGNLQNMLQTSYIAKWLYQNNLLLEYLNKFLL